MASSWGLSWGTSWGNSWGGVTPTPPVVDLATAGFRRWLRDKQAQEATRKEAQELIDRAKQPGSDIAAIGERAQEVSAQLQEDVARMERAATAYQEKLAKRATKTTRANLMHTQNDARATRQLQAQVLQAKAKAQALAEELDIVFVAVALLVA